MTAQSRTTRTMTIDILLTVYNGAAFLPEQIRSVQGQTHRDWRLWVRDDGSIDGSPELVRAAAAADARIRLVDAGHGRLGALGGFSWLLEHVDDGEAPYTMFCDQDDVWLPHKIEVTLAAMRSAEAELGPGVPLLAHTDLQVVDAALNLVDSSFWHYQGLRPGLNSLRRLLIRNTVTGCTAMINRALRERGTPVPAEAVMHDWWLALVAGCFGRIVPVPEATVLYRQHGHNATGAKQYARGAGVLARALRALGKVEQIRRELGQAAVQAGALLRRFGPEMRPEQRRLVSGFSELRECGPVRRRLRLVRLGTLAHDGLIRNIGYVLRA